MKIKNPADAGNQVQKLKILERFNRTGSISGNKRHYFPVFVTIWPMWHYTKCPHFTFLLQSPILWFSVLTLHIILVYTNFPIYPGPSKCSLYHYHLTIPPTISPFLFCLLQILSCIAALEFTFTYFQPHTSSPLNEPSPIFNACFYTQSCSTLKVR